MSTIIALNRFAAGITDYIAKHNENADTLEGAVNAIFSLLGGQIGTSFDVPNGLQWIFDRAGIIGQGSYAFNAGSGSSLSVAAGAFWTGQKFYSKSAPSVLSLSGFVAGTYYLTLDASGNPLISATPDNTTSRQFAWDGSNTISSVALYAGVAILFSGADYAAMLTSLTRAKNFTTVAERLEEIEVLLGKNVQTPASADTININWALGGVVRVTLDRATTTFAFSGAYDGQKLVLELIQDVVGGRGIQFGSEVVAGMDFTLPVPLSAAEKTDYLGFIFNGSSNKYHYTSLARGY